MYEYLRLCGFVFVNDCDRYIYIYIFIVLQILYCELYCARILWRFEFSEIDYHLKDGSIGRERGGG